MFFKWLGPSYKDVKLDIFSNKVDQKLPKPQRKTDLYTRARAVIRFLLTILNIFI
jgi:hypothetical protein